MSRIEITSVLQVHNFFSHGMIFGWAQWAEIKTTKIEMSELKFWTLTSIPLVHMHFQHNTIPPEIKSPFPPQHIFYPL